MNVDCWSKKRENAVYDIFSFGNTAQATTIIPSEFSELASVAEKNTFQEPELLRLARIYSIVEAKLIDTVSKLQRETPVPAQLTKPQELTIPKLGAI